MKDQTVLRSPYLFISGNFLSPVNDKKCHQHRQSLLVANWSSVQKNYLIKEILPIKMGQKKYQKQLKTSTFLDWSDSLILPAFFDMHFHWVQDDVRLMPKDSLLEWLNKYTFPTEAKFAEAKYAEEFAKTFFQRLLKTGTMGGACYSSVHEVALHAAMKHAQGDFILGNVLMTMESPENLLQKEADAVKLTKKFIKKYGKRYCLTPRFAITTHPEVMKETGKLADKNKIFKQSHLSENLGEIDFVLKQYRAFPGFSDVSSYTEIYERSHMLGKRSLMAHGIHLSKEELKTLSKTQTSLIHCPTSNAPHNELGLESGLFDFEKVEKAKIRWALGSDIGGGPYLSMLDVMRSFVSQHKALGRRHATFVKSLYRASLAGAEILGLSDNRGSLSKGKFAHLVAFPLRSEMKASAEQWLSDLITPLENKREQYDQLPSAVFFRGKILK